jgi:hypothetical protein
MQVNSCKNCNEPINGNYCSNCGQPTKLRRIDGRYIIREITSAFNAERGMLYTTKKLLISPGESVKHYITEDRRRYVKPITFLIITSLIYTLICHFFNIGAEEFYFQQPEIEMPTLNFLLNWMIDNNGYLSIITGLFIAFPIRLFFRKYGYNLFEIFVLLCYLSGIASFIFSVILIFQGIIHLNLIHITVLIVLTYYTWAIGQFFDKRKAAGYIKAFLSYLLGLIIFSFLITFIAIFIDIIIIK